MMNNQSGFVHGACPPSDHTADDSNRREGMARKAAAQVTGVAIEDVTGKRGVSRGLTPDLILNVAKELVAKGGIDNFKLIDVATVLKVRSSAIYNFFNGREDLLTALSTQIATDQIMYGDPDPSLSPQEKLDFIVSNMTRILYNDRLISQVQLIDIANSSILSRGNSRSLNRYSRERLYSVLEEGIAAGVFRKVDLHTVRSFLIGGICARVLWSSYDDAAPKISLPVLQREVSDWMRRYLAVGD